MELDETAAANVGPTTGRRLDSLSVPDKLQRNDASVVAEGVEKTGELLLRVLAERIGRSDLEGFDLLDIGCGVRFTQTLVNRDIPFASYTGIEVSRPIVNWLAENVETKDDRFHFAHWDVYNAMYNRAAPRMESYENLPVPGQYDVVTGYSLFTHLDPSDSALLLQLARKAVRDTGHLFFTAFCDETIESFEDRVPGKPLLNAYYNPLYLQTLLSQTGWTTLSLRPPEHCMMHSFLCRPATVGESFKPA